MTYKEYDDPAELRKLQLVSAEILQEFDRVCTVLEIPYFIYAGTALGAVRHKGFIPWDDDIDVGLLRADYEKFLSEAPRILGDRFEVVSNRTERFFPACNANLSLKGTLCVPDEFSHCPYQYAIGIGVYAFDNLVDDAALLKKQCRRTWLWGRLAFLRATPSPHLFIHGWRKSLASFACHVAYGFMRIVHLSPQWIYTCWEKAATMYNSRECSRVADFTDKCPSDWSARLDELFPTKDIEFEGQSVKTAQRDDALLRRGYGDYMQLPPMEERKNHHPFLLDFGDN